VCADSCLLHPYQLATLDRSTASLSRLKNYGLTICSEHYRPAKRGGGLGGRKMARRGKGAHLLFLLLGFLLRLLCCTQILHLIRPRTSLSFGAQSAMRAERTGVGRGLVKKIKFIKEHSSLLLRKVNPNLSWFHIRGCFAEVQTEGACRNSCRHSSTSCLLHTSRASPNKLKAEGEIHL
jgi:hypothetical protein